MNRVELPISQTPITSLPYLAYPLAILLNYEECKPWFFSNYIQVYSPQAGEKGYFTFFSGRMDYGIPMLMALTNNKKAFTLLYGDLYESIICALNNGMYINTRIDTYYDRSRRAFQKRHMLVELLVYGFDRDEKRYLIWGPSDSGVIEKGTISMEDFINACMNTDPDGYLFLAKKDPEYQYELDMQLICDMAYDYINSVNSSKCLMAYDRYDKTKLFGMETYKYLLDYCRRQFEREAVYDSQPLQLLWEHKRCMALRVKYLVNNRFIRNNDFLYEQICDIEKEAFALKDSYKRYEIYKSSGNKEFTEDLMRIEEKEFKFMEAFLKQLNRTPHSINPRIYWKGMYSPVSK